MSVIEITAIRLGYYEVSREYNSNFEKVNHYEWIEGCGPSGEVGISIDSIYNVSSKGIKEVEFKWVPVDASGDVVGKEIKCKAKNIGSFDKHNFKNVWERLWVAPTAQNVKIITVSVTYHDGSEEIIAGEDVKFIYDKDSEYQKILNAEKKKKEGEKKAKEQAEIDKKLEEENARKSRGIVACAGRVDGKDTWGDDCRVETVGDVTFYLEEEPGYYCLTLVGWESTKAITHLNLPLLKLTLVTKECLKNTCIKSVMFPRSMKYVSYRRKDRGDLYLGIRDVQKIVIPKETESFSARPENMGSIREVEFEDPCGWGVSKKIITDPQKMYEYIVQKGEVELHKSFINKIKYKLGL